MSTKPKITVIKSSKPIIWLDTSIIIKITEWKLGMKMDAVQQERSSRLYNIIYQMSSENKIICPMADQEEEIWAYRKECFDVMLELSFGVTAHYSENIKIRQTKIFMEAYVENKSSITINSLEFLSNYDNEKSEHVINVDLGFIGDPIKEKESKIETTKNLEALRAANVHKGITYHQQLEKEYNYDLQHVASILHKLITNEILPNSNPNAIVEIADYFNYWKELKKEHTGFPNFFQSTYYREIPFNKILSMMSAKILTDNEPIRSGHKMDLYHAY